MCGVGVTISVYQVVVNVDEVVKASEAGAVGSKLALLHVADGEPGA